MALTRVSRYLAGAPQFMQKFEWQTLHAEVRAYTDSDWAGDRTTRKSTSGGVVMSGSHMLKSWSSTQQLIALSSSEAELYALLKGATQAKRVMSMLKDYGFLNGCTVHTDASAAMGITHRVGLGRARHIEVQ